jgi:hypothetical protein
MMTIGGAQAADDTKYPDWKGQWIRIPVRLPTQPSHDQTKPWGFGQQAPLTPEYQALRLDVGRLYHLGPFVGFICDEFGERNGREWKDWCPKIGKSRLDRGICDPRIDRCPACFGELSRSGSQ